MITKAISALIFEENPYKNLIKSLKLNLLESKSPHWSACERELPHNHQNPG